MRLITWKVSFFFLSFLKNMFLFQKNSLDFFINTALAQFGTLLAPDLYSAKKYLKNVKNLVKGFRDTEICKYIYIYIYIYREREREIDR